MKKKSEAFSRIKQYVNHLEQKYKLMPKVLRVDNGSELTSKAVKEWCAEKGITLKTTVPYSHQQLGVAERFHRTLIELARAILIAKNLPKFLWAEAVAHAAYLRNRAPTRALNGLTPEEAFTGEKPDISHLQEFGSDVWVLTQATNKRGKLDGKAKKSTFVGYNEGPAAIRYYDATQRQVRESRNYAFNWNERDGVDIFVTANSDVPLEGEIETGQNSDQQSSRSDDEAELNSPENIPQPATPNPQPSRIPRFRNPPSNSTPTTPVIPEPEQRSRRQRTQLDYGLLNNPRARPTVRPQQAPAPANETQTEADPTPSASMAVEDEAVDLAFTVASAETLPDSDDVPRSLAEAKRSPLWDYWRVAMEEEMAQLIGMTTWEVGRARQRDPI
jgi:hypothetical protein